MLVLSIESIGTERMVRGFNRYAEDIQDWTDILEDLYQDFVKIERENFSALGQPEKWQPLSPRYAKWKERHYPGQPLMVLSGALRASLTDPGGALGSVKEINGPERRAVYATGIAYAHRHQVGWRMPRRKVVQLTEEHKRRWGRMVQRWAYRLMHDAFGGRLGDRT